MPKTGIGRKAAAKSAMAPTKATAAAKRTAAKAAAAKRTTTVAKKTTAAKVASPTRQPAKRQQGMSDVRIQQEIRRAQTAISQLQKQIADLENLRQSRGQAAAKSTDKKAPAKKAVAKKATVYRPPIVKPAPKKR